MIEVHKRLINYLVTGIIFLILGVIVTNVYQKDYQKAYSEKLNELAQDNLELLNLAERAADLAVQFRKEADMKDSLLQKKDSALKYTAIHYTKVIDSIKKDKKKAEDLVRIETGFDTTIMAIKLIELAQCKEENSIIIEQREILKDKSAIQENIIVTLEKVIDFKDTIISNNDSQIKILSKANKKLTRKLKFQKTVSIIVGAVVVTTVVVLLGH